MWNESESIREFIEKSIWILCQYIECRLRKSNINKAPSTKKQREEKFRHRVQEILKPTFKKYDANGDGMLDFEEFLVQLNHDRRATTHEFDLKFKTIIPQNIFVY